MRTQWLINLVRQHPQLNDLTTKELGILGMYRILTMSSLRKEDPFGMVIEQKSVAQFPESWGTLSKTKSNKFLADLKIKLAVEVIEGLLEDLKIHPGSPYQEELMEKLSQPTFTTFTGIPLRFVEFFSGYLTILELIKLKHIPLVVGLKQFIKTGQEVRLNGSRTLVYLPQEGNGSLRLAQEDSIDADEPALAMEIYTGEVEAEGGTEVGSSQEKLDEFLTRFQQLDIREIILTVAATHAQYTNSAFLRMGDKKISPVVPKEEGQIAELYKDLHALGNERRIGTNNYWIDTGKRFSTAIPINVQHTYVSTFRRMEEERQKLWDKIKDIKSKDCGDDNG